MKKLIVNPFFQKGFPTENGKDPVSTDVEAVRKLLAMCPVAAETPLVTSVSLAKNLGINKLWLKDERNRMGLGSFKALGATFVIASHAANKVEKARSDDDWKKSLSGETYVSASAGNHGLSLAAGARIFGAKAVIYLSKNVPSSFADRIRSYGADVVIHGDDYEESLQGAQDAAQEKNWFLLSDVTWDGYDYGLQVMQGYLVLAAEAYDKCSEMPTHIFLQAGVGGFPASMATLARKYFGDKPKIIIVEPTKAPVLQESINAGKATTVTGGVSNMGRLDCKSPSLKALYSLAITCTHFITIEDEDAENSLNDLDENDLATTPSGGAGYAAIAEAQKYSECGIDKDSKILVFLTEKQD